MLKKFNFLTKLVRCKWNIINAPSSYIIQMNTSETNSITEQFYSDFHTCFDELDSLKHKNKPIILTSENEGYFCAGINKKYFAELIFNDKDDIQILNKMNSIFERLFLLERPAIAAVNGNAISGGFIMSLCCDFRFFDPQYYATMKASKLGLSWPSSVLYILKYEIPYYKKFLLTGDTIDAETAIRERISLKHKINPLQDALNYIENDIDSVKAFISNKKSLKNSGYMRFKNNEGVEIDKLYIELIQQNKKRINDFLNYRDDNY